MNPPDLPDDALPPAPVPPPATGRGPGLQWLFWLAVGLLPSPLAALLNEASSGHFDAFLLLGLPACSLLGGLGVAFSLLERIIPRILVGISFTLCLAIVNVTIIVLGACAANGWRFGG